MPVVLIISSAFFSHVQVNNDTAIEFYKKFGFEIVETKKNYYKRIEPADAHVLELKLRNPDGSVVPLISTTNGTTPSESN